MMKKIGKWILVVLFLVIAILYVNKEETKATELPQWQLNETKTITLNSGESVSYSFTAPEDGLYSFWSDHPAVVIMGIGMGWDLYGANVSKHVYQENYQAKVYVLEAGRTYEIRVSYGSGGKLTKTFGICKTTPATSMSFSSSNKTVYSGTTGDVYLNLSTPGAMGGTYTWTSSDPSVVKVARNKWSSAKLSYGNPGTATITVSNGSVSASINITVLAPLKLQEGTATSVDARAQEEYNFTFTPGTSGKYLIKTEHMIGMYVQWPWDVQSQTQVHIVDGNQGIICPMAAGYTYTITMPTVNAPDQVEVTIELLSAQYVTPPTGYQEQKSKIWELTLEEDRFLGVGEQSEVAYFTPTETGTYYMFYHGHLEDDWYVLHNGTTVPIEEIRTGDFGEVEHRYTFEAGETYIMCNDAQWESDYLVNLSRETHMPQEEEEEEGSEDNQEPDTQNPDIPGDINSVDPGNIDSIIEQMPPGTKVELTPVEDYVVHLVVSQLEFAAEHQVGVKVTSNLGSIDLDYFVLDAIGRFFQEEEVMVFLSEEAKDALTQEQQERLEEFSVNKVLHLSISNEEGELHDFEGGSAVIRLPFDPEPGKRYHGIYIREDGKIEIQPTNWEEGYIEFVAGHFSTFAIVETAEDEYIKDDFGGISGIEGDPGEQGGANGIGIVAAVVVAAAAVVAGIISKKRNQNNLF
ncbi:MAG: Ig domain-containing protein [Agathobacter sp.]|nr:Ig domain-containing protein [Agathobacter sp.]